MASNEHVNGALPKTAWLFAQLPLIVYDLRLLDRLSKVDRLVLDSMLYHTTRRKRGAPDGGACCVMTSIILREHRGTKLRWATQVERSMARIEKIGLYKRKGFRVVGTLSVRLYYQATGLEVWEHAREHKLIPKGWAEDQALREHQRRERAEAARFAVAKRRLEAGNCGEVARRQPMPRKLAQSKLTLNPEVYGKHAETEKPGDFPVELDAALERFLRPVSGRASQ